MNSHTLHIALSLHYAPDSSLAARGRTSERPRSACRIVSKRLDSCLCERSTRHSAIALPADHGKPGSEGSARLRWGNESFFLCEWAMGWIFRSGQVEESSCRRWRRRDVVRCGERARRKLGRG